MEQHPTYRAGLALDITLGIVITEISHSETRSTVAWYFESKNLALKNALKLRCPLSVEQQKELRQYYSEYFVGLVSATELLREPKYSYSTKFNEQLFANFVFGSLPDGKSNYSYIRELRNSIIHRGLDICSAAHVNNDFLLVVAPSTVSDREGKKSFSALGYYLIEVISKCEEVIGPLIARHLEEVGLLKPLLTQDQAVVEANRFISESLVMPEWVKQQAFKILSTVDFVEGQAVAINSLVGLLNFNALSAPELKRLEVAGAHPVTA